MASRRATRSIAAFGTQVALLHSGLTPDERAEQWHRIRRGEARIDPAHRKPLQRTRIVIDDPAVVVRGAGPAFGWRTPSVSECEGDMVARRSLEFYDALGRVMAVKGNA